MWMHYENGKDYLSASCAIATSSSPVGPFTYHGHFNPLGYMSRDCTLFMDNQKAYFISASNDNKDLHIYLLNEDYLFHHDYQLLLQYLQYLPPSYLNYLKF